MLMIFEGSASTPKTTLDLYPSFSASTSARNRRITPLLRKPMTRFLRVDSFSPSFFAISLWVRSAVWERRRIIFSSVSAGSNLVIFRFSEEFFPHAYIAFPPQ